MMLMPTESELDLLISVSQDREPYSRAAYSLLARHLPPQHGWPARDRERCRLHRPAMDGYLRLVDIETGDELWKTQSPEDRRRRGRIGCGRMADGSW